MPAPIAITGASGQFGGAVARYLSQAGVPLRLLVRDTAKAPSLPNSTVHVAPYDDAVAVTAALKGIEIVLLVSIGVEGDRAKIQGAFVDAAKGAGVKRIAYTSCACVPVADPADAVADIKPAADASFLAGVSHGQTEDYIRASGLSLIALRNGLYAEAAPQLVAPGTGKARRTPSRSVLTPRRSSARPTRPRAMLRSAATRWPLRPPRSSRTPRRTTASPTTSSARRLSR